MKIIIVGASGFIGSYLYKVLKKRRFNVKGTYSKNRKLKQLIYFDLSKHPVSKLKVKKKDIIILLSAYTNPGWISKNKTKTKKLNIIHTKNFIKKICEIGAKIIFMSSIEVFDGKKNIFLEHHKPKPLNFYGKTKFEIEKFIKKNSDNYLIFRTSWNSDITLHKRCVIELTYKTIIGKKALMASDNIFSITYVQDTANIISNNLLSKEKIIHISNRQKISRSKLAQLIKERSKKGNLMNFKKTKFKNIKYAEPRGLKNILGSKVKSIKGFKFTKIDFLINKKLQLLDKINF